MYTKTDITGAVILSHVGLSSIGAWNEAKIDSNLAKTDGLDLASMAIALFEDIAAKADVSITGLSTANTARINAALLWYIAGEIKDLDIGLMPCEQCCDDDHKQRAFFYEQACRFLHEINPSLTVYAEFCADAAVDDLPAGLFTGELYVCGEEVEDYGS